MMKIVKVRGVTRPIATILLLLAGAAGISFFAGCAGMTPPTGGPRDSLPPVVMNVTPADSTLGFTGNKIEIQFNEFVQVEDVQKNLLVSPVPKVNPTIEARLRTVTVTIRDTLEENTTYVIDFGNSIRDYNESNILRNYRYLFSTGRTIDSLNLGGRVIVAETGRPDSTLMVMLHTSLDDSAVVKDRPRYVTRLDSAGNFRFDNISAGTYAIYALKDEGGSRRYLSKDALFAYHDSTVTSQSERNDILLYAFVAEDTSKPRSTTSNTSGPSGGRRGRAVDESVLRFQTNAGGDGKDLLTPLEITFSERLRSFDTTKISFTDTAFRPIQGGYYFTLDTSGRKVNLVHQWAEDTYYTVVIDTAFAEDTLGRHIAATDTITFQTKKNSEYGLVRLRFLNLPLNRKPLLLLVQGDEVKYTHRFTNNQFYAPLFNPGDYEMRLVFDENGNGKWDTGNFFGEKRQPEKVQLIQRKLNVKPNWDSEIDIQL